MTRGKAGRLAPDPDLVEKYVAAGWWGTESIAQVISKHARTQPQNPAYIVVGPDSDRILTWRTYESQSTLLANVLIGAGLAPGDRVAVIIPDGAAVHIAFLAAEKAGLVVAGIGARAGEAEMRHLIAHTGSRAAITLGSIRGHPADTAIERILPTAGSRDGFIHIVIPEWPDGARGIFVNGSSVTLSPEDLDRPLSSRMLGPDDLFMLNSTSGTTGLPKCVMHTQNRWFYFHRLAAEAGALNADDVFMGAVPAPFGFGLWTAHFTPSILGAPTLIAPRFDADTTLQAIARYRVTVLCCVSTQFLMMLNAPSIGDVDLSALRVMFTGGEAVPFERAAAFEDRTGAAVLQFYGSNETGALSGTTLTDSQEQRLRTAGHTISEMHVRMFGEDGQPVTGGTQVGIPACKGPATCLGYYNDDHANSQLFTSDGWMLMGDIVEIDAGGYLRVVGRTSDFIIRGGKNLSAPAIEAQVAEHPAVALVAVVSMPDQIFGERVCAYVVPSAGADLTLDGLAEFLESRGVTREWFPEKLILVESLPRSSGAKIAKSELRADIRRRLLEADS